jgi:hypothetical protein
VAAACCAAARECQSFDGSPAVETLTRRQPGFEAPRDAALVSTRRDGWRDDAVIAPARFTPSAWTRFAVSELRRFVCSGLPPGLTPPAASRIGALASHPTGEHDASEMIEKTTEAWQLSRNLASTTRAYTSSLVATNMANIISDRRARCAKSSSSLRPLWLPPQLRS